MGNRISISFKKHFDGAGVVESPALFSHWQGTGLITLTSQYLGELNAEHEAKGNRQAMPLDRLDPGTIMVDLIRWLTKDMERVEHDLYLGKNRKDGDNSENGHFVFDLDNWQYRGPGGPSFPIASNPPSKPAVELEVTR